ncbi:MAG: DegT/DnrJ/EryC1/StrS family aminotransferase [Dictyoglomaceae bacterium]
MAYLAICGGKPVREKPYPSWPIFDEKEEKALIDVLKSGKWGRVNGKKNEEFEEKFARYHSAKYGITCVNGTAALEIALKALGVGPGDEVIVPAYTFIATASAVLMVGAKPVFVDIDPKTYNIDPEKIESAITPKTKAVIPVHIGGCPANMDKILDIAKKYNLRVLEDAAQAHGAEWRGKKVGALGDMGIFSFQSSKNINAGEGGIILTNDEELAEKAWSLMNVGRAKKGEWYMHYILSGNYRMTEFQAGILLAQMERMEELMKKREENAKYLTERLKEIEGIEPLTPDDGVTRHAYHLYIFKYKSSYFKGLSKMNFVKAMNAEGIPLKPGYTFPLYRIPAIYNSLKDAQYENLYLSETEKACTEEGVWFSQNVLLGTKEDMDDIITAIKKIQEHVDEIL